MLCITGWIESESSHPFITPTNNWTCTWFGAHIFWHDTRLLMIWNKETIINFFLYKIDSNANLFNYSSDYFILNNRDTNCVVLPMYYSTSVAPVCIYRSSVYLCISLFLLAALYMHLISPSVEPGFIAG